MPRTPWKCHPPVARIARVLPDSIAEELELLPGDVVCTVNGMPVTDYIAYRFAIAEEEITLKVARGDECVEIDIEKDEDEELGIVFDGDVFDGVRACRNNCVFCFEAQMPEGMRASLNLRDDDYRLSFLHGNFLSLTNLSDDDLARIIRDRLTPLFVSIHATDLDVRRRMLRNAKAPDVRAQLRQLGDAGIEVHAQIVLCPGWNDGAVLAETLSDLAALYPTVQTVGIVPVGLTAHRQGQPELRAVSPEDARAVLELVEGQQRALLEQFNTRQVFAADEFYLLAGHPLPADDAYEGYPQRENGIGMARLFLDELVDLNMRSLHASARYTLVTGELAAPLIEQLALRLHEAGVAASVIAVPNRFYGGGVTVAGLLSGQDLIAGLAGCEIGDAVILPATALNADGIFLDDLTPEALASQLGVPVLFCAGPAEVVETIMRRSSTHA